MTADSRNPGDALYDAVLADDAPLIARLARKSKAALEYRYLDETPLLHCAAYEGKLAALSKLLDLGRSVDEPHPDTFVTPLEEAAGKGYATIARELLRRGAMVDGHPSSITSPLCSAAIGGHLEVTEVLVEAGADLRWEGRRPGTPLDLAIAFQVKKSGQDRVADYLLRRGATRPYSNWHNWREPQVEFIERNVGMVNPSAFTQRFGKRIDSIYRSRFAPPKSLYQLLFTASLAPHIGAEIGIVLPARWPLNVNALTEARFGWPVSMLHRIADAVREGLRVSHGDVVRPKDEIVSDLALPALDWIVAKSEQIERARRGKSGAAPLLLLTGAASWKPSKRGKEAQEEADKRSKYKWERLVVPLPDLTPVGFGGSADP